MWLWLIFGGIFAVFGVSTLLSAIDSGGVTRAVRFIVAMVLLISSAVYFRNAWSTYRDSKSPK